MTIRSGFFNSVNGDRKYDANKFAEYFASFIGNGVFPNPSDNLQIMAQLTPDMTVTVKPGKAWINGYILINDDDYILQIEPADGVLNRIDRIVARYDVANREITLEVKKGIFASSPVAPVLQRDADAYELGIADIKVNKGAISITQADITDLRLNSELCGIVHGVVDQVDTTAIFNQFESWYAQTKANYDADIATWTQEKKDAFDLWYTTNINEFTNRFNTWFSSNTTAWDSEFTEWFDSIRGQLEGDVAANLASQVTDLQNTKADKTALALTDANLDTLNNNFSSHLADDVSQGELHGFRLTDGKLEYFDGQEWQRVKGDGYPVGNISNLSTSIRNSEVTLTWQDPPDVTIEDSEGNIITIARWAGTKLVRKTGSYPVHESDGTLIIDNTVYNQYQSNGFIDDGLTNGMTYYYMLFPYTEEDVVTIDSANRISATPQAYDDLTGSPGPKNLIAGTMEEGFFGEVSSSELITGDDLASSVGISQGTSQHSTAGWLKFSYKGEIQFIAKKPIRHSISWDAINTAKCVYGDIGDKTVTIDYKTYKVTLMRASEPSNDPKTVASANAGVVNHHSEWNRLMCQIHEQAISDNWDYKDNVESDIGILEHNLGSGSQGMYNDNDLLTHSTHGGGSYSWCQEMGISTSSRLLRGGGGVSDSYGDTSSNTSSSTGWRPRLELVP